MIGAGAAAMAYDDEDAYEDGEVGDLAPAASLGIGIVKRGRRKTAMAQRDGMPLAAGPEARASGSAVQAQPSPVAAVMPEAVGWANGHTPDLGNGAQADTVLSAVVDQLTVPFAPPVAERAAVTAPARPDPGPRTPAVLEALWEEARDREGQVPGIAFLDHVDVCGQWPNSLLLGVRPFKTHLMVEAVRRYDPPKGSRLNAVSIDSGVIEWVCEAARSAVRAQEAVRQIDSHRTPRGWVDYGVLALPLTTDGLVVDRVLCHVHPD